MKYGDNELKEEVYRTYYKDVDDTTLSKLIHLESAVIDKGFQREELPDSKLIGCSWFYNENLSLEITLTPSEIRDVSLSVNSVGKNDRRYHLITIPDITRYQLDIMIIGSVMKLIYKKSGVVMTCDLWSVL